MATHRPCDRSRRYSATFSRWLPPRPGHQQRRIAATRVRIGDRIIAVNGRGVGTIRSRLRPYIASSTVQSFEQRVAVYLLQGASGSEVGLTLQRGDEPTFEVVLTRSTTIHAANRRPRSDEAVYHLIDDDIGYIDLERLTPTDAERAIDELINTRALILDLRGYPQGTAWTLAPRLALDGREGAVAALFRRPVYREPGPAQQIWTSLTQSIPGGDRRRYQGRIIVLIDDRAVSQAEHSALLFEAAADPVFVGTPTTGANGDITNISLPGGLSVSFSGHDVRHADGRQLQRIGIQPNILVAPTFVGMATGRDEVLEAGIAQARAD